MSLWLWALLTLCLVAWIAVVVSLWVLPVLADRHLLVKRDALFALLASRGRPLGAHRGETAVLCTLTPCGSPVGGVRGQSDVWRWCIGVLHEAVAGAYARCRCTVVTTSCRFLCCGQPTSAWSW
jgi:hypothetical protein